MSSNVVVFYCLLQLCIHSCLGHLHALMAFGLSLPLDYVLLQMRSHSLSFFLKIEVCSGRLRRVWWGYQQLIRNLKLSSLPRLESLKIDDNDIVHCNTASVNLTQLKMIDESPDLHSPYDESDSVSEKTPSFFSIPPAQNN